MYSISVIGCGGAGVRLLDYIPAIGQIQKISINTIRGDIVIDPEELKMYENIPSTLVNERLKWIREIKSNDVFLLAGLGGQTGSTICKIIGKAIGKRKRLWGIFILPFAHEGDERRKVADKTLKYVAEFYRGYILMDNDSLARHYPDLKLEVAMEIPGVVAKHIVIDFLRIGLKNMLNKKMRGNMGVGIGFGVGKERIKVAIEDALRSPWIAGGDRIILISGRLQKDDAKYIVEKYEPYFWDVYTTDEYGEQVKATVIEIRK